MSGKVDDAFNCSLLGARELRTAAHGRGGRAGRGGGEGYGGGTTH